MSNKLLTDVGQALYGPRWQSDLARDLAVSDRQMRRWVSGAYDPPSGVYLDLMRLCLERAGTLDVLVERLKCAPQPEDTSCRQSQT
jgi:hypothetical protein